MLIFCSVFVMLLPARPALLSARPASPSGTPAPLASHAPRRTSDAHGFQGDLFARGVPRVSRAGRVERVWLDERAWVEWGRGWLEGAEPLFHDLLSTLPWKEEHREMYDRVVRVPRWIAPVDVDAAPVLREARRALETRYEVRARSVIANYYRDGSESVAFHSDRESYDGHPPWTLILSLGGPRRLGMRPARGGKTQYFTLGSGDLFVIGSGVHDGWHHGIPKVRCAPPRMSVVFFCEGDATNHALSGGARPGNPPLTRRST